MFIEKLEAIDVGEPIYGRTIMVVLLKEQLHLDCAYHSIDISPLRGFSRQTPLAGGRAYDPFRVE